ncbi:hypothetical protein ACXET9_03760 [Brachybacterium sp. DNPG3]
MSLIMIDADGVDALHPDHGWGDVPVADRPLWSRYMVDHLPWFPGAGAMSLMAPGVMNGGTRAPQAWKDAARALHAAGFTPAEYYLLAELLRSRINMLDPARHALLFEQWPTDGERRPRTFRLAPERWVPWLEEVRAGESPRRALGEILRGEHAGPMS